MRFTLQLTALVLLISQSFAAGGDEAELLSRLVDSVWKEPATTVDMEVKVKVARRARAESEIRKRVSESMVSGINSSSGSTTINEAEINTQIDKAVEELMRREGNPQYHYQRYRASDRVGRVDTAQQDETSWGPTSTFSESRVNGIYQPLGVIANINYNHLEKSCTQDATVKRYTWDFQSYRLMGKMEKSVRAILRGSTGRPRAATSIDGSGDLIEKDDDKSIAFLGGQHALRPKASFDLHKEQRVFRVDFSFSDARYDCFTLLCDPIHPSNVLMTIIRDKSNRVIRTLEQSGYSDGVPSFWKESEIHEDGTVEYEERRVTKLNLVDSFPSSLFSMDTPAGYLSSTILENSIVLVYPDGRTEEQSRSRPDVSKKSKSSSRSSLLFWNSIIAIGIGLYVIISRLIRMFSTGMS